MFKASLAEATPPRSDYQVNPDAYQRRCGVLSFGSILMTGIASIIANSFAVVGTPDWESALSVYKPICLHGNIYLHIHVHNGLGPAVAEGGIANRPCVAKERPNFYAR